LIFLFTAAFTPTPDPITMTVLAIPICLLYFISGLTALILDKRKNKKELISDDDASTISRPESI
jgi:sec-independent protein translocase protein TatC